jgi:hypothetical protein
MRLSRTAGKFPAVAADIKTLGEIIAWNVGGVRVTHSALVNALRDVGFDARLARELAPRHAWTRACKRLEENRIIRPVEEDRAQVKFQFTQERRVEDGFEYDRETVITLDKLTGRLECDKDDLKTTAQQLLDEHIELRFGGDVTRLVQRLFERKADLFPVREQGGCYFVPKAYMSFVDDAEKLVSKLGGTMRRFPIAEGTERGDRAVRDAVVDGIESLVADHLKAVDEFDADTRQSTVDRAVERIEATRFKVDAYAHLLTSQKDRLLKAVEEAKKKLAAKVASLRDVPPASPTP